MKNLVCFNTILKKSFDDGTNQPLELLTKKYNRPCWNFSKKSIIVLRSFQKKVHSLNTVEVRFLVLIFFGKSLFEKIAEINLF